MRPIWMAAVVVVGSLVGACSCSSQACTAEGHDSYSVITVIDSFGGQQICDATVTVDGSPVTAGIPPGKDAGCAYLADNGPLGNGDHAVVVTKPGFEDAHATIHVSGVAGGCPQPYPKGQDLTITLLEAPAGGSGGSASDAGP